MGNKGGGGRKRHVVSARSKELMEIVGLFGGGGGGKGGYNLVHFDLGFDFLHKLGKFPSTTTASTVLQYRINRYNRRNRIRK